MTETPPILRLKKRHSGAEPSTRATIDPVALAGSQSLRGALYGAMLAALILNVLWVVSSMVFDRFFPWFSIVQGFLIGRAVRRFGDGFDWRFPLLAAVMAFAAAVTGSFISALNLTGREFGTGALPLITEISWHTIRTFLAREFGAVGTVYGLFGAALAANYSRRILDRDEASALRAWRERVNR